MEWSAKPEPTMREMTESMLTSGGFPKYQVKNDGTLIIEGDMVVRCADLLKSDGQFPSATPEVRRQMRQANKEHVRVCTKAGFPPDKPSQ